MTTLTKQDITRTEDMIAENCDLCQAALVVRDEVFHASGTVENLEEIAKEHGVTVPLLKRRLGIGAKRIVWTPGKRDEFKKDAESGATVKELSEKWGLSASRVGQLIADYGVDVEKGKQVRAIRQTERFSQLAEWMATILAATPELSAKGVAAWITKVAKSEVTEVEVAAIGKFSGVKFGDLDAFPEDDAKPKAKPVGKKVRSKTGPEPVEDVELPDSAAVEEAKASIALDKNDDGSSMTQVVDDVVTVKERDALEWIREFFKDTPDGTLDDYQEWAGITGAPKFKELRDEYGSWSRAKELALDGG